MLEMNLKDRKNRFFLTSEKGGTMKLSEEVNELLENVYKNPSVEDDKADLLANGWEHQGKGLYTHKEIPHHSIKLHRGGSDWNVDNSYMGSQKKGELKSMLPRLKQNHEKVTARLKDS
jgi:hypothetical protein